MQVKQRPFQVRKNFYPTELEVDTVYHQTFLGSAALLCICCAGILGFAIFTAFGIGGLILSLLGIILFFFCGWVIGRWLLG